MRFGLLSFTLFVTMLFAAEGGKVSLVRVPDGGIQPQAVLDGSKLHLIYYKGDAAAGDIFYTTSSDFGATFSPAIQVDSVAGSAIAMGNIRGAHLAVGKNGRAHVAWMGSDAATPRGPKNEAPMLYARIDDAGKAFEEQRNVIQSRYGLDGGGSVAADAQGNVYVLWHGGGDGKGEIYRQIWLTHSSDDGKTFSAEKPAFPQNTGACGCCGMRAFSDSAGTLYVLYRAATEKVNRDMYLLLSRDKGTSFTGGKVDTWNLPTCPMSTAYFAPAAKGVLSAWENKGQVYFAAVNPAAGNPRPIAAPGAPRGRKFPAVASNSSGEILFAWTEGMGWEKGGSLSWQLFDKNLQPLAEKGTVPGVPKWSVIAAIARPDGGFTIFY